MRDANRIRTNQSRQLRGKSTDAEAKLWYQLRARRLGGFKFVRQEAIGLFTVDFICREQRLVIEVDGGQHADNVADARRDRWLNEHDFRVLRFWNNDVMGNIDGVLQAIATALTAVPPHPVSAKGGNRPLPASGER